MFMKWWMENLYRRHKKSKISTHSRLSSLHDIQNNFQKNSQKASVAEQEVKMSQNKQGLPSNFSQRVKVMSYPRMIFVLLLIGMIALSAAGCGLLPDEQAEEELPIISPPTLSKRPEYTVTTETIETRVRGIGKIMSMQEESLFFTLEGQNYRVKDIYVNTGDVVEAGQLIAELDVTELRNQLRTRKLQFRNEEIEMIRTLRRANEMSAEDLEQAKIDFEQKRTDLLELEEQIERSQLRAPFTGTIVSLHVERGDSVQAYEQVAVIADLNQLVIAAEISQSDRSKVAVGMEARVDINAVGQFEGKVKQLPTEESNQNNQGNYNPFNPNQGQQKDSIDRYMLVDIGEMPPEATRGTPLSVSVVVQRKENAVVIPPSTLRTYGGRTYVQVVEEDGTRREVDIEVGQQTATQVEVIRGLEPGQKVVGR